MILVDPFQVSIFCDPVVLSLFGSGFVTLFRHSGSVPSGSAEGVAGPCARFSLTNPRARHTAHAPS